MTDRDDAHRVTPHDPPDALTGEVDPAWLARLRAEHEATISAAAERDSMGGPNGERVAAAAGEATFDAERTIGGDADLLAEVREAVRRAREGLAAPPSAPTALPPPRQPSSSPPGLAPPVAAIADTVRPIPAPTTPTPTPTPTPTTVMDPPPSMTDQRSDDRWRPPPRLKPAATPQPSVLLTDQPTHSTVRTWVLIGVAGALLVAAALILVVARSGGSTPSDNTDNGSSTSVVPSSSPGAPAGVATTLPVAPVPATGAATTTVTTVPASIPATTVAPTVDTTVPATIAPTAPPDTVAPAPPPETVATVVETVAP